MTTSIGDVLREKKQLLTVNSYKNINNNTVNSETVSSDKDETIGDCLNQYIYEPEAIAKKLAEELDDKKSEVYFLLLAKNTTSPERLIEALSYVKNADSRGNIKTKNKSVYFLGILKNWGIVTKFKNKQK